MSFNQLVQVMKALSTVNRLKIIKMLQEGELCVCEIQEVLEVSQPIVSRHLKLLEQGGLVDSRKKGQWVYYQLSTGGKSPFAAKILEDIKGWLEDSKEMDEVLKRLHDTRRKNLCKT